MKLSRLLMMALLTLPLDSMANTRETREQVTGNVTIADDVDYVITSATPFADDAIVDITNTDHATLILEALKPSVAITQLSHVRINGQRAANGTNCQVKIYNRGAIILPYGNSCKPLTVYSEPDFQGDSVNDFGLEHSNGFMNTLTEAKLNNRIQSFRLKRGYMVTFSTRAQGRGYSRCFIAADRDLEVAELPGVLNKTITSYRIFKWYDTGKQQLAAASGDRNACSALNVTSTYGWGPGEDMSPDVECVPHHIHEGWPSPADLGNKTYSPHMKTNNEPRNSSDDSPNTLAEILGNWEQLMATGMRLCSPSSWDGSDYVSNVSGFLREFFDSIDARGWRCDIIDLHCYWPEGSFSYMKNWTNAVHRPIWISEWVWGASWNSNGAFASGVTEAQNAAALKRICPNLNSWDYVERYYYWNGERDPSRIYKNGQLTEAGKYYASINSGLGYNGKYDYVPTTPRQYDPQQFKVTIEGTTATITWRDENGEFNRLMEVQRKLKGGQWTSVYVAEQREQAANYNYIDNAYTDGTQYRVHVIDVNGRHRYTNADLQAGDLVVTADGRQLYAGGNLFVNGDFDLGLTGWTSGTGQPLTQPYFQTVTAGGIGGGCYLQAYQSAVIGTAASLKTAVAIEPQADYYFRTATCNGSINEKFSLSTDGKTESQLVATLSPSTDWEYQEFSFNSGDYSHALLAFRNLGTAQLDKMELRRLFDNYDDAIADGAKCDNLIRQAADQYLEEHPNFDESVWLADVDQALANMGIAPGTVITYTDASVQPQSPSFASTAGWQTKTGTYKSGDQRTNTVRGKTCWNAWWSGLNASTGKKNTMEIRQELTGLPEGIYAMECRATTQHYCLSDQHGFMVVDGDTVNTPHLQADYFDLPSVGNIWQTLTTLPVFIPDGGTAIIGFTGSKQGATDNAWHAYGNFGSSDKREGWWCATDFRLLYHPVHRLSTTPGQFFTICLPYAFVIPEGMHVYELAGMLTDQNAIALSEVTETEAGVPYVYTIDQDAVTLYEYGETADRQTRNCLRGYLATTNRAPSGSYVLEEGQWRKVTTNRPNIVPYTAIIYKIEAMNTLASWDGLTMPIVAETDAVLPVRQSSTPSQRYTLDGRPASSSRGITIEVKEGQARKQVHYIK